MQSSQPRQPDPQYLPQPRPMTPQPVVHRVRPVQFPVTRQDNFNFPSVPVVFPGLGFGLANGMQRMFKM